MKKAILIASVASLLLAVLYLGYRVNQPPAGVRLVGTTAKVISYAMLDENKPQTTYTMLDTIPAVTLGWLMENGYEAAGFEPQMQLGYGDTLNNRHPYFMGYSLYTKRE